MEGEGWREMDGWRRMEGEGEGLVVYKLFVTACPHLQHQPGRMTFK